MLSFLDGLKKENRTLRTKVHWGVSGRGGSAVKINTEYKVTCLPISSQLGWQEE